MQRQIPIAITVVVGFAMVIRFFFEDQRVAHAVGSEIETWGIIIAAIAYFLGLLNLLRVNGTVIMRFGKDWFYKLVLVSAMLIELAIGVVGYHVQDMSPTQPDAVDQAFRWVFDYLFTPLSATMFSLLAFFVASAAFRAFRAKSFEATLLLTAGVIVMLGRVPLGNWLTDGMAGDVTVWILNVPNLAGQRAIVMGAALGMISAGLRILLGIEKPYLK